MTTSMHAHRVIKAIGILFIIVCICVAIDRLLCLGKSPTLEASGKIAQEFLLKNNSLELAIESYPQSLLDVYSSQPTDSFKQECFNPLDYGEVFVDEKETTLFLSTPKNKDEIYTTIDQLLKEKGWSCVESGIEGKNSYVKATGDVRWLFIEIWTTESGSAVLITKGGENGE